MIETYPKGRNGYLRRYRNRGARKGSRVVDTGFHGTQGVFAKDREAELMDVYSKPGNSKIDPYAVSRPTSRFRSAFP